MRGMYAVTIGEDTVPAGGTVMLTATTRLHSFVLSALMFQSDWEPPRPPWWWRNRFTRWLLRKPPFRRLPPRISPPLHFTLIVDGRACASFDAIYMAVTHLFQIYDGVLVLGSERLEVEVKNYSDKPLKVFVQASGYRESRVA